VSVSLALTHLSPNPARTKEAVLAPRKKPAAKVEVEEIDDELDEDELDLDDLADDDEDDETEDEAEEDEDEDEDEDDEVPAPKKKAAKGKTAAKGKKKSAKSTVSAQDLADALSTDEKKINGRELRVMLRQKGIDKIAKNENNRYEWDSIEAALEQMGFEDLDDARDALVESRDQRLEELKEKVAKKKGKKKKAPEPVEEEDDEDEDEEEDEEPAPKKKAPAKKKTATRK